MGSLFSQIHSKFLIWIYNHAVARDRICSPHCSVSVNDDLNYAPVDLALNYPSSTLTLDRYRSRILRRILDIIGDLVIGPAFGELAVTRDADTWSVSATEMVTVTLVFPVKDMDSSTVWHIAKVRHVVSLFGRPSGSPVDARLGRSRVTALLRAALFGFGLDCLGGAFGASAGVESAERLARAVAVAAGATGACRWAVGSSTESLCRSGRSQPVTPAVVSLLSTFPFGHDFLGVV